MNRLHTIPVSIALPGLLFFASFAADSSAEAEDKPNVTGVYQNDFSKAIEIDRWSSVDLREAPDGGQMLWCPYELKFTMKALPEHQFLRVRLKLVNVGSHDGVHPTQGPDDWSILDGEGTCLFLTNFRNADPDAPPEERAGELGQSYPDEYPAALHPAGTGALKSGKQGENLYSTYDLELVFPHRREDLVLEFFSGNHNHGELERYAIRSFEVDAISGPEPRTNEELDKLWQALKGDNALEANKARWNLIAAGRKGANYVQRQFQESDDAELRAAEKRSRELAVAVAKWVGQLGHDEYKERTAAKAALAKLHPDVIALLKKEMKADDPEVRAGLKEVIAVLKLKPRGPDLTAKAERRRLVRARVEHIQRLFDIPDSGRRLSASTGTWLPLGALDDGYVPVSMNGTSIPKFAWRRKEGGKEEWVQYDFPEPRIFNSASVFWFEDRNWDKGAKLPESWSLLYKSGDQWKPVKVKGKYGISYGKFDEVEFEPVNTTAIRLQSKAQANHHAGLMEFRLGELEKEK